MDSGDIKNIEKAVQNVEKKVDDVKKDVVNKMDDIENVLTKTKNAANNIAGNTSSLKDIKDKVGKVVTKLEALKEIQKWTKEQSGSKNGKTNITGNIEDGVKNILKQQQSIFGEAEKISKHTESINTNTKDAADYLRLIKEHIVDGSASNKGVKNADESTSDANNSIHATVKDILLEIKGIRDDLSRGQFSARDDKDPLNALIRKNKETEEKLKERELEVRTYEKYGKITRKDKDGKTLSEKEFLKQVREERKEEQRRRDKLEGKRSGEAVAAKIATETASIISEKQTVGKLADKGISAVSQLGPYGAIAGGILSALKAIISLGDERDRATSTYARTIGGGRQGKINAGQQWSDFRNSAANRPELGFEFGEYISAATEYAEARGRSTERMSNEDLASSIMLKRMGIGADALNNFDTFGKSLQETDRYFAKLYGEVSKKGLSFKNVSKAVNDNLKQAQSHTFANGLRGLEQMAEKSVQLKYNMQQVFTLADKVSEIEGAISTAANLSVLGGQFAQFSNPMQLLYEGLNDVEALNDRMVKMFSGKAHWDAEKGEMTMDAIPREFIKQAAKAAGLDPNEMLNMSFNEAKLNRISSQIRPGTDKDTAEYIRNLGELDKNGQEYVSIKNEKHYLNESYAKKNGEKALTVEEYSLLQAESERKEAEGRATLGNIWSSTNGIFERIDKMLAYLQEKLGAWVLGIFNKIAGREEKRKEKVRQWAEDNNKDYKSALAAYYNTENGTGFHKFMRASNFSNFMTELTGIGTGRNWRSKNMDKLADQVDAKMAGGSPIPSLVPGNYGFANGPTHWNGGIKASYGNKPVEIEKNEFLLNRQSSMKYRDMLPKLQNGTFNPYSYANSIVKNDMNKHYMPMQVTPFEREMLKAAYKSANSNQPNTISGTIKVDIPQRITIDIAGGNKIGDYDISSVIAKYVDSFMKEMMMKNYTGFNKEDFHTKTVV